MSSTERFGYEWNKFNEIIPAYEIQFLKWVYPLKKEDFKNKVILDAGCGIGRNSYWPLKYGAKKVVAFDFDKRTVEVAKKNLSQFSAKGGSASGGENAEVIYQSIYDIAYENEFDLVFSIGVIHHLEKPEEAIKNLIRALKPGGQFLIWVYGKEGNEWIIKYVNPLRRILFSRLPIWLTNFLAYFFSFPLFLYLKIFSHSHLYFKQLAGFRFWHVHSIVFDQFLPKIANYWSRTEALNLFKDKGLKDIEIYSVNNNSWTLFGTKI